jgi:hypothetical protein
MGAREIVVEPNIPQLQFLQLRKKFRAFVGGFGTGKTAVGGMAQIGHFHEHPGVPQGYFAPTYPHIRDIFYPTIEEVAFWHGMRVKVNESNKEVHFYRGRFYYGTTICRSMEHPESIIGFKIGRACVDEIDVMKEDKATRAWRKIIARLRVVRPGLLNGIDVTTTPEGFKFTYKQFVEQVLKNPAAAQFYGLVQASTYDNAANLPDDYIASLIASYPEQLIEAYLRGRFINLTTGSVYRAFDRARNTTDERILPNEPLHIGMDFNVGKMAAVVHVLRKGRPYALFEFTKRLDTPAMIADILTAFPGRNISVYPDASGQARKTVNASESDLSLLRAAGFNVVVNPSNPAVKDRINAMNACLERGYWVNPETCPDYVEALEKQAYDEKGEPDKSGGYDHVNDAGGYCIVKLYPIQFNRIITTRIEGR